LLPRFSISEVTARGVLAPLAESETVSEALARELSPPAQEPTPIN